MRQVAIIGAHIFDRPAGAAGEPGAFTGVYAGRGPLAMLPVPVARAEAPLPAPPADPAPAAPDADASGGAARAMPSLPVSRVRPFYADSGRPLI
jgi:hypothetical protein